MQQKALIKVFLGWSRGFLGFKRVLGKWGEPLGRVPFSRCPACPAWGTATCYAWHQGAPAWVMGAPPPRLCQPTWVPRGWSSRATASSEGATKLRTPVPARSHPSARAMQFPATRPRDGLAERSGTAQGHGVWVPSLTPC